MQNSNSGNLSKGDVISFIALLLLGVTVFFGMNFSTLGDRIQSIVVAAVLITFMVIFVFLAAFAKAQNRNQAMWKKVEYAMLFFYVLALIPCYLYSSKFYDIQFNKANIVKEVQGNIDDINKMFSDYDKKCQTRSFSYKTSLQAMSRDVQGRKKAAEILGISADNVTNQTIDQASESFLNHFRGNDYSLLLNEKTGLENSVVNHFKNWNILLVPQYAEEVGAANEKFALGLQDIYDKYKGDIDGVEIPSFKASDYTSGKSVVDHFTGKVGFSLLGFLGVIIFGGLGLIKYFFGEKRTVIDLKKGDSSVIMEDGGFSI